MIRNALQKIKTSIWLYPLLYSLFAFLLALVVTWIDKSQGDQLVFELPGYFYTTSSLARDVLGIIAAAFITISTFTFSTTMVVITMYSSQFTPRVVENFLNNETTMKSFGVFLSGFIYAIVTLLFLTSSGEDSSLIAASVGVVYIIVGFVSFLLFIQNVSSHVQASGLIQRLYDESQKTLEKYCHFTEDAEQIRKPEVEELLSRKDFRTLCAHEDGYIQEILHDRLQEMAEEYGVLLVINKVVGQFVTTETPIVYLFEKTEERNTDDLAEQIKKNIVIGHVRTESQDFDYTISKIVEIAVKALSAGINDPNTAIQCIKVLGLLLKDLGRTYDGYLRFEVGRGAVFYEAHDLRILLTNALHQIVHYGKADIFVIREVFKSLRYAKSDASKTNRGIIQEYADSLMNRLLSSASYDSLEKEILQIEYEDVKKA